MENILTSILLSVAINGAVSTQEPVQQTVLSTVGNDITIGQTVDVNTTRVIGTMGNASGYTCWPSPVYGSNGLKEVKVKCQ
jgi:hypothetical protein